MTFKGHGLGWLVDYPDFRDYTPHSQKILDTLYKNDIEVDNPTDISQHQQVDNRKYCTPIKDQGEIGSCTAFAAVGMYEYLEKRVHGKYLEGSELFVYKLTRYIMSQRGQNGNGTGDTGAFIRNALGCLVYYGVPPAETYPYDIKKFEDEPATRVYILAQNYQVLQYFRLDHDIKDPEQNLFRIKEWTLKGFPIEFGFTCYKSALEQAQNTGAIPYPHSNDSVVGGHAVMICGYDDNKTVGNTDNGNNTTGAFIIRNSWGREWGEEGYGYLPYEYILSGHGLAQDFWTIIKAEWVDKDAFHW